MRDWTYGNNNDVEIRIDLSRPEATVEYRLTGDTEWQPSPFQSVQFRCGAGDEQEALITVDAWLESQS